jgi:hypothetical protein
MRRILALAAVGVAAFTLGGCSSRSGYNLDVRNTSSERVKLEVISQTNKGEPKIEQTSYLEGGAHKSTFTECDAGAIVQLSARIDGDTVSDPALKRLTLGKTELIISPAPNKKDQPPKAPKVVIRERSAIE